MNFNNILDIIEIVTRTNKKKNLDKQTWDITTTTYAPPYVVVEKKIPSPKEDSVNDLGHNYHHVRAAVRGGRKKKILSLKEDLVTDLGQNFSRRELGY